MSGPSDEELMLRDYLLGGLDEAARERVEERLLGDDGFAARLYAAEDALIDDYVFEALPAGQRESFDRNFVIDGERRRKLLFARALEIYVDERRETPPPARADSQPTAPPWKKPLTFILGHKAWAGVAALALLLLLFLAPAALRRLRTPDEAALLRERRARAERRVAEFNKRPADQSVKDLPTSELALQPTLLREDGRMPRVVLDADVKLLTLKLAPPEERRESYSALVLTVEGEELFAVGGLTPEVDAGAAAIRLNIPADMLRAEDYQVRLRAPAADGSAAEVGRYYFRVITRR
jgi:hypothetical protein